MTITKYALVGNGGLYWKGKNEWTTIMSRALMCSTKGLLEREHNRIHDYSLVCEVEVPDQVVSWKEGINYDKMFSEILEATK